MSAWSGWVADMISGLGIPDTADNRNFLTQWEQNDPSRCQNNPLVASWTARRSSNCKPAPGALYVQNYASPGSAIRATARQLASNDYPYLRDALMTGHPLNWQPLSQVVTDLNLWGATGFAAQIAFEHGISVPGGAKVPTTHVTAAWSRWMRTLAHKGPSSHRRTLAVAARANRIARKR